MKKIAILQSNYIPWKGYFSIIKEVDAFVIYDEVQFTKNDWRNRNKIKTPHGLQWLTIPVKQKTLHQKIYETEVVDQIWKRKHLNSLRLNYSKAACYNNSISKVEELFSFESNLLTEVNVHFLNGICKLLNINTPIIDSRELNLVGDKNEKLIDACNKMGATSYLSGASAKEYINLDAFKANGIEVEWMDYSKYKDYPQLFPPFEHGVSILDMIFNIGNLAEENL